MAARSNCRSLATHKLWELSGHYIQAGCDHRLHSTMTRDKCGICGGDGTTCRTVKGTYNERGSFGYNAVRIALLCMSAGAGRGRVASRGCVRRREHAQTAYGVWLYIFLSDPASYWTRTCSLQD